MTSSLDTPWTPGPWEHIQDAQGTCGLMVDENGRRVAVAWLSSAHKPAHGYVGEADAALGRPEREANARLISKAPEMAEMMQEGVNLLLTLADALEAGAQTPREAAAILRQYARADQEILSYIKGESA